MRRPLTALLGDFFGSVFSLDSRAARTLGLLVASPGRLTRAFLEGKRERYVPPFRGFLFSSILFFGVLALSDRLLLKVELVYDTRKSSTEMLEELGGEEARDAAETVIRHLGTVTGTGAADIDPFRHAVSLQAFVPADEPGGRGLSQEEVDALVADPKSPQLVGRLVHGFNRALLDPKSFNTQLNVWLPRLVFLLVPVFAFLMRLSYWGPRQYFVNHLYFSLHFHTFLFLLLTALVVLIPTYGGRIGIILFSVPSGLHLWLAMKTVFREQWPVTTLKWALLGFAYFIVLTTALALTLLGTFQLM